MSWLTVFFHPITLIIISIVATGYLLYIKYSKRIEFICYIIYRFILITFRYRKKLLKRELYVDTRFVFKDTYLKIKYDFKNAIWYNFVGISQKAKSGIITINTANIVTQNITLVVYGFFQKQKYVIQIPVEYSLIDKTFAVKTRKLNNSYKQTKISEAKILPSKSITVHLHNKKVNINQSISILTPEIKLNKFIKTQGS